MKLYKGNINSYDDTKKFQSILISRIIYIAVALSNLK